MVEERIELLNSKNPNPFIDSPGDFLAKHAMAEIMKESAFKKIFKDAVEAYERQDFGFNSLPAMRIYNLNMNKVQESHYIVGQLNVDVIFPASIARSEMQYMQDLVSGALLQQFRRPAFFAAMRTVVPGLNELGKEFSIDKSMGMVVRQDVCPLTQIQANFRIDLKEWDAYLERECRTKDDPFRKTLETLDLVASTIEGMADNLTTVEVTVPSEIQIGGES